MTRRCLNVGISVKTLVSTAPQMMAYVLRGQRHGTVSRQVLRLSRPHPIRKLSRRS